jgi:hypothetical protein
VIVVTGSNKAIMGSVSLSSAVGIFGMSGGRVDDPHRLVFVVNHVPYAASAGDLILPLFEVVAVVSVC